MRNSDRQYSDQELIARIKEDSSALDILYTQHRLYCLSYLNSLQTHGEMMDIYHDAVLVFYEKVRRDVSFVLSSSIQTYLNSVCRNILRERMRREGKYVYFESEFEQDGIVDKLESEDSDSGPKMKALLEALSSMKVSGGKCFDILMRFFYLKQSMERIAYEMDYSNADNAKNQKARCQKRLKFLSRNILFS